MAHEVMNAPQGTGADRPVQAAELKPVEPSMATQPAATQNPFLTRGNLMLVGMLAAGIAGVWLLSLRNGPSQALADQGLAHANVEQVLERLGEGPSQAQAESRSTAKAIVREFYTAARQRQVAVKQLKGNPFIFEPIRPPDPVPDPNAVKAVKPVVKQIDIERANALKAAQQLGLQSVLLSGTPKAMISNQVLAVGDVIVGWKITRIEPKQVELRWKNETHLLQMPK
jgi:hypothetical protein